MEEQVDARKAVELIKQFFIAANGKLAETTFKVTSAQKNHSADWWVVDCQLFTDPMASKPTQYHVRVNVATKELQANEAKE